MSSKRRKPLDSASSISSLQKGSVCNDEDSRIDTANALPLSIFESRYLPQEIRSLAWVNRQTNTEYTLSLETAKSMSSSDLQACFNLIKTTSSEAYRTSSVGWSPNKKKKEMQLPDLRYLLVKRSEGSQEVEAFTSFMLTVEDSHEVVYCYEIHLADRLRGCGLGKKLMGIMEGVGQSVGMEKAMLTVFLKNEAALIFYERLGYLEDEFSPPAKRLRNGSVKRPNYVILSKALQF